MNSNNEMDKDKNDDFLHYQLPSKESESSVCTNYLIDSGVIDKIRTISDVIYNIDYTDKVKAKGAWNQTKLDAYGFNYYISAFIRDIEDYSESAKFNDLNDNELQDFKDAIDNLLSCLDDFSTMAMPQLKLENPQHFKHIMEAFLKTIFPFLAIIKYATGHSSLISEQYSYRLTMDLKRQFDEKINEIENVFGDTSSVHKTLTEIRKKVRRLSDRSNGLDDKVTKINAANEHVVKLPQILENLELARADIQEVKESSDKDKFKTQENIKESDRLLGEIRTLNDEAQKLVLQCRNARHITTTESLANGFEDKATQLKKSIRFWVLGLFIGLVGGAFLAHERVAELSNVLNSSLTTGQAILQVVITLFSLGGPLWWAWLCTSQVNKIFKLSEDYSYKASVAKAYTGFKDESEKFDEKVSERLFNSTLDRFDEMPLRLIDTKDHSSPWNEFLNSGPIQKAFNAYRAKKENDALDAMTKGEN